MEAKRKPGRPRKNKVEYDATLHAEAIDFMRNALQNPEKFTSEQNLLVDASMHILCEQRWSYANE